MKKMNIPMTAGLILLCLTMVSMHFSSGLYAKYTETRNGTDSASVAEFHVETDLDYISMGLADNETPTFELGGTSATEEAKLLFYIESGSEVATSYSVKVDFGAVLPNYVTLTLSDGTKNETIVADGTKTTFEFEEFGTMEAVLENGETERRELVLTIGVTSVDLIQEEIELPTAALTVRVNQIN